MFFSVLIIKLQKIFFFSIFIQSVVNCLLLHDALRLIYFLFVSCFYFNGTVCLISFYFYAYFSIYVSSFLAFSYSVFLILSEDVSSVFHLPKWYVFLLQLICMLVSSYFCHPPKRWFPNLISRNVLLLPHLIDRLFFRRSAPENIFCLDGHQIQEKATANKPSCVQSKKTTEAE